MARETSEQRRERYERRKKLGLCVKQGCSARHAEESIFCPRHREQHNALMSSARQRKAFAEGREPGIIGRPRLDTDDPELEAIRARNRERSLRNYHIRQEKKRAAQTHA